MQAIKLVTGVTPTCFRVRISLASHPISTLLTCISLFLQPPYGDIDDRIRAIAHGLGLRTVLWKYDSQDWQFGFTPNVTVQTVDNNYETLLTDAGNGLFDDVWRLHRYSSEISDQSILDRHNNSDS